MRSESYEEIRRMWESKIFISGNSCTRRQWTSEKFNQEEGTQGHRERQHRGTYIGWTMVAIKINGMTFRIAAGEMSGYRTLLIQLRADYKWRLRERS
jgi:hypothetical protein